MNVAYLTAGRASWSSFEGSCMLRRHGLRLPKARPEWQARRTVRTAASKAERSCQPAFQPGKHLVSRSWTYHLDPSAGQQRPELVLMH